MKTNRTTQTGYKNHNTHQTGYRQAYGQKQTVEVEGYAAGYFYSEKTALEIAAENERKAEKLAKKQAYIDMKSAA